MARDLPPAQRRQDGPGQMAILSLFLVLLAFFILLNSMARPEQGRARDVLESVNEAFQGDRMIFAPDLRPQELDRGDQTLLLDSLEGLFQALLPEQAGEVVAQGRELRLELDSETLFLEGGSRLRPERQALLTRIVEILDGSEVTLQVMQGVESQRSLGLAALPAAGRGAASEALPLPLLRSGAVLRALLDKGLDKTRVSAGLLPGRPGRLLFVFLLPEAAR